MLVRIAYKIFQILKNFIMLNIFIGENDVFLKQEFCYYRIFSFFE